MLLHFQKEQNMVKTVKIGGQEITLKSSAAIPHMYRRKFNRDIFIDMEALQKNLRKKADGTSELDIDSMDMFENLTYCFAKHADPTIPDDPLEWFEQFEILDIYSLLPAILDMWGVENISTSQPKKK